MVTPPGGPRERCPFFSHDLSVRSPGIEGVRHSSLIGRAPAVTPPGGPRKRCPFFSHGPMRGLPLLTYQGSRSLRNGTLTLSVAGWEAPWLPLRGARGSAAHFPVEALVNRRPTQRDGECGRIVAGGDSATEGWRNGRHRTYPSGGPAGALPDF